MNVLSLHYPCIVEYKVVSGKLSEVEKEIYNLLNSSDAKWQPQGGINFGYRLYHQAMVRWAYGAGDVK